MFDLPCMLQCRVMCTVREKRLLIMTRRKSMAILVFFRSGAIQCPPVMVDVVSVVAVSSDVTAVFLSRADATPPPPYFSSHRFVSFPSFAVTQIRV